MAAETKKKGFTYRIGFVFGGFSACYRRLEAPVIRWAMKKGMPATLASLLSGLIRLSLIGAFLYLAFWVVVAVIATFAIKEIIVEGSEIDEEGVVESFDADNLFPDPYSLENINDPAFHRKS
ncbi:DUF3742 family protein [Pseudomonas gingeri]|uniref:DUF3742 family protein n=1 Tax=Pseudomonas gingeri TaxID=117681 RepID=UPI0015BD53D2|nr:DUF3742 family protein [Pseudomonas gingeri]NWD51337.1 DUF3742 family protein [Pseudomonas gingeri]